MSVLLTALDVVQTAGLEPAHTSWRGALPTELRLHIGAGLSRLSNPIRVPLKPEDHRRNYNIDT